jgi:predicted DNA-binding transcriptional regulator YafY
MRRADRLFQIIQILRRHRRPVTAAAIAAELETSQRSVYRDIATLMARRVPIRGEAGVGYVLEGGHDMPPLMLTADEIEAAVLGAKLVAARGDPALVRAAQDLIAKIAGVVPEHLRPVALDPASIAPPGRVLPHDQIDVGLVRAAIHDARKLHLAYRDELGRATERIVWPIAIGYLEAVRLLIAWCELRNAFRHFRTDRVLALTPLDQRFAERPAVLRARWRRSMEADHGQASAAHPPG